MQDAEEMTDGPNKISSTTRRPVSNIMDPRSLNFIPHHRDKLASLSLSLMSRVEHLCTSSNSTRTPSPFCGSALRLSPLLILFSSSQHPSFSLSRVHVRSRSLISVPRRLLVDPRGYPRRVA
jgi:hypothetical protein